MDATITTALTGLVTDYSDALIGLVPTLVGIASVVLVSLIGFRFGWSFVRGLVGR